jgi:NADH:ubiquinone oxidoreductase subunit F (NADH-binding)
MRYARKGASSVSDFDFDIEIRNGVGGLRLREETALINSMKDKRGRAASPSAVPSSGGTLGESRAYLTMSKTYANVSTILLQGADWVCFIVGTAEKQGD